MSTATPVELVAKVTGEAYERAVDDANAHGGSTQAVAEHLLSLGQDRSPASVRTTVADLEDSTRQLHGVEHKGARYWLQIDHHERVYTLYRRAGVAEPGTFVRPKEQSAP